MKKNPSSISSGAEIEELPTLSNIEAFTQETRSIICITTLSLPSAFNGEMIPPVELNSLCMSSIFPRGCRVVSKITSLPELINLQFIESQYAFDPQLSAIRDLIKTKEPKFHKKLYAMNQFYS